MAVQDYKINYKSDFVLTINGDAGWATQFCIKFWTGMPSQAYFVGFDGVKYVNCRVGDTPTQLLVMFDDHHLPIGKLMMQIAYHTTIEEFPGSVFDEVTNARDVIVTIDGTDYQVMLDFTGEDAPELEFDLPAYANEAERIQNELQRQQNEADRIAAELQREQATAAAVQGAENVNAQLNGTTLTVTNRNGVSTSVNTKGERGEQGPVGPEGPQGEQGVSITGLVKTGETETDTLYNATFSDGTTQAVAIPKGAKGDTGPTGPQGPQGQTGVSITGLVKTGETETDTLYNVTFSDGTTQAVAIPKGAKGDQGEQGPQGPQGPMGDVAVITPEQQAAFTMYSVPGQNTNGPMTQKAVTDNLVASSISYDNSQSNLTETNVQGALDDISTDSPFEVKGSWRNGTIRADGTPNYNNVNTRIVCDYIRVKNGSQIRVIHNGQKASINVYYPDESYMGYIAAFTDTADATYTVNITGYDYGYIRLVVAKSDDRRIYVSDRLAAFYVYPPMFEDEIVKGSVKIPTSNAVWNYRHTKESLTCPNSTNTWIFNDYKGYAGTELTLILGSTTWDISGVTVNTLNILNVRSYDANNNATDIIAVTKANVSTLAKKYTFTVPSDCVTLRIAFRGTAGTIISYMLLPTVNNELYFEGKDNSPSYTDIYVAAGKTYRVTIKNPNWDKTGITSNYLFFIAAIYPDNTYTYLALQTITYPLDMDNFVVKMPSNSTILRVGGRAVRGTDVHFYVDDITGEDLNTFRSRGGIVVANWNIGHFSFGNNSSSSITSSNYATEVLRYNEVLKDLNADMVAVEEYSAVFGNDGNGNKLAKNVLFNEYPYLHEGVANGFGCQAMFNYKYMAGLVEKPLSAFGITTTHLYSVCTIKVQGVDVKFVGIHFQWFDEASDAKEILQFQGIIDEFANDPYVIIAGDFNTKNINNFQMFANAGYTLANGGAFGTFDTFTDEKPSQYQTTLALDNIVTKGFIMSDVRVIQGHLSDHYPIACRLMLKQN